MIADRIQWLTVAVFKGRRRGIDEQPTLRWRCLVRKQRNVVDERCFAGTGWADDADNIPHPEGNRAHLLRFAGLSSPLKTVIVFMNPSFSFLSFQ